MAAYTTIDDPSAYFKVQLYTGNGSTQAITFDDTDTDMQPDFVWLKNRNSSGHDHFLFNSTDGVQKFLSSNDSGALSSADSSYLTAFGSDGFTLGSSDGMNENSITFVSWNWKESATAGFDLLSYTGNSTNRTIAHSLSAAPHMIIIKSTTHGEQWVVGHNGMDAASPWNYYMHLQDTVARAANTNRCQNTAPSSSVFSIGTEDQVNGSKTYTAFLFAPKQGFSKFSSYVGNGSTNGTYVHCGFRPAWVMCKVANGTTNDWTIIDNKRDKFNPCEARLYANTAGNESDADRVDFLANGFKHRGDGNDMNGSGHSYIYMAFAESPFVNSNGVPNNAR